jgi:hypothetical protein
LAKRNPSGATSSLRSWLAALLVVTPGGVAAQAAAARVDTTIDDRIAAHLNAAAADVDPRVVSAVARIDGLGPKLLALRSYWRARATLAERWSWSAQKIARYEGSPLQRELDAEIARVRSVFEADNPGYTLWVNPQVRSVELQLERWNDNDTVRAAGAAVLQDVRKAMVDAQPPAPSTRAGRAWLGTWLAAYVPQPTPALAAPGLSPHGRMSAVDFQVRQGDRTVAGPSVEQVQSVWNAQGWRARLQAAVTSASRRFHGPLRMPDEPWHYDYEAESGVLAGGDDP